MTIDRNTAGNTGLKSEGASANITFSTSIQVQCRLTDLCSEIRPNTKPEKVVCHLLDDKKVVCDTIDE